MLCVALDNNDVFSPVKDDWLKKASKHIGLEGVKLKQLMQQFSIKFIYRRPIST